MEKEFLEPYSYKEVVVGVPHATSPKPFFYYGKLIKLTDTYLLLQFKSGIKQIQIADIIDIHLDTFVEQKCKEGC